MNYTLFSTGNKEYKLSLNTKALINLEKRLGKNPINVILGFSDTELLPDLIPLLTILHESLQAYNHGISMDDVYDIYDEYVSDGKGIADLITTIVDVFTTSGILPKTREDIKN